MLDGSLSPMPRKPAASEIISLSRLFLKPHPSGSLWLGTGCLGWNKSWWLCCATWGTVCTSPANLYKDANCSTSLNSFTLPKLRILGEFVSYVYMLLDTLIMVKSSPLGFPVPLLIEDCICGWLNLRSNALAELGAKVAFQCQKSPSNGFAGDLQG